MRVLLVILVLLLFRAVYVLGLVEQPRQPFSLTDDVQICTDNCTPPLKMPYPKIEEAMKEHQ